jgi:hypothetical protein
MHEGDVVVITAFLDKTLQERGEVTRSTTTSEPFRCRCHTTVQKTMRNEDPWVVLKAPIISRHEAIQDHLADHSTCMLILRGIDDGLSTVALALGNRSQDSMLDCHLAHVPSVALQ